MENQRFYVIYGLIRNKNVGNIVFQPIKKFPKLGTVIYIFMTTFEPTAQRRYPSYCCSNLNFIIPCILNNFEIGTGKKIF